MNSQKEKQKQRQQANVSASLTEKRKKSKSPQKHKKNVPIIDQKNLLCEMTRLKGQQKLLYVKQMKQKKVSDDQFFATYPFCKLDTFTFNMSALEIGGKIIRDDEGLHYVQQNTTLHCHAEHSHSKFQMNGWAISVFNDGKIIEGVYHDSHLCGMGYELQPNGNTYVGQFKEGNKSGKGIFYWFSNGEMYEGDWLGGLPHGTGKYLNGDLYQGQFSNGMKYGSGQEIFKNGDRYVGSYLNGVADGYGQYFWSDGSIYKGDFKHGVRHGYGIWTDHKETQNYSGCYRMDKKEGFGVYEWVGKQCYKGEFREDYREGYGRLYQLSSRFQGNSTGQSQSFQQKMMYQGIWQKGKQKQGAPIDKQIVKKLDSFLSQNKLNSPKKRKRIGHQNCVPNPI